MTERKSDREREIEKRGGFVWNIFDFGVIQLLLVGANVKERVVGIIDI